MRPNAGIIATHLRAPRLTPSFAPFASLSAAVGGFFEPLAKDTSHSHDRDPVKIRKLDFFPISKYEHLVKQYVPALKHGLEGLQFVRRSAKYEIGGEATEMIDWASAIDEQLKATVENVI